jgi:hypothetical protein
LSPVEDPEDDEDEIKVGRVLRFRHELAFRLQDVHDGSLMKIKILAFLDIFAALPW